MQSRTTILDVFTAPWKTEHDILRWKFSNPTRVSGFELEKDFFGGLTSILVADQEQLVSTPNIPIPLIELAQFYPNGASSESPFPGWKIGPIMISTIEIGMYLTIKIESFKGRIRPFGCQVIK